MASYLCRLCEKDINSDSLKVHISWQHFKFLPFSCTKCNFKCHVDWMMINHFLERGHGDHFVPIEPVECPPYLTTLINQVVTDSIGATSAVMPESLENPNLPTVDTTADNTVAVEPKRLQKYKVPIVTTKTPKVHVVPNVLPNNFGTVGSSSSGSSMPKSSKLPGWQPGWIRTKIPTEDKSAVSSSSGSAKVSKPQRQLQDSSSEESGKSPIIRRKTEKEKSKRIGVVLNQSKSVETRKNGGGQVQKLTKREAQKGIDVFFPKATKKPKKKDSDEDSDDDIQVIPDPPSSIDTPSPPTTKSTAAKSSGVNDKSKPKKGGKQPWENESEAEAEESLPDGDESYGEEDVVGDLWICAGQIPPKARKSPVKKVAKKTADSDEEESVQPRALPQRNRRPVQYKFESNEDSSDDGDKKKKRKKSEGIGENRVKEYPCRRPRCAISYKYRTDRNRHEDRDHNGVVFECDGCMRVFRKKSNMTSHYNSEHLGIRIPCPNCPKEFTDRSHCNYHMKFSCKNRSL